MPKTKISEYSVTNSSNTDIEGINIDEGCAPSGINNAIRELMVHLKEFQTGASGDAFTFAGGVLISGTANTITGNVLMSGTNTITGSTTATFAAGAVGTPSIAAHGDTNTGIYFPAADTIAFAEGGTEVVRIDSSGNVKLSTAGTSVLNSSGNKILNQTGSVLQVVSTTSSTVVTNTGTVSSLLSASITPSSTSNKILILTSLSCVMNANTSALGGSFIYRGTTSGTLLQALYSGNTSTPTCYGAFSHSFLDSPSTTSSQTYTLGINRGSGGTTSQVTEGTYSLILMEISA